MHTHATALIPLSAADALEYHIKCFPIKKTPHAMRPFMKII